MDTFARIGATIAQEFSDLRDVEGITRVALRLVVAALLGAVLGYDRERRGKAAGVRTHMLVAIGCALFVLVPVEAGVDPNALSRVMQGVVAGIGFLGAGAILKRKDGPDEDNDVHGLTTAASIWMTSALGIAAGLGREATAILSAALALAVLTLAPHVTGRGRSGRRGRDDDE